MGEATTYYVSPLGWTYCRACAVDASDHIEFTEHRATPGAALSCICCGESICEGEEE